MPPPKTWNDFLNGPVLVISKNSENENYQRTRQQLKDRGFTNIIQIDLPSIKESVYTIQVHWNRLFGNKPINFNQEDAAFIDTVNFPNKQESAVAHFNAYNYIITNKFDFALVVEDNIIFHKDWDMIASKYFEVTPPDYYLCYVGHHCGCGINAHVIRAPTFSMQSIIITSEGAQYLLDKMLFHPKGVRTLDCMINEAMTQSLINQEPGTDGISNDFCNWYAWNAEMFPDETAVKFTQFIEKDKGLIFQEDIERKKMIDNTSQ
jgi:hypothetical protein